MSTLCVACITSRQKPCIGWFFDSLHNQCGGDYSGLEVIVVDLHAESMHRTNTASIFPIGKAVWVEPKPDVWQGKYRLTKQDWWGAATARNTALCLCKSGYIIWIDDRCVLATTWLEAARKAMDGNYAVCGNYEKRYGMVVDNGVITVEGTVSGRDERDNGQGLRDIFSSFWGGTMGCPTEWALDVNGFEELTNGLGSEDYIFGMMLNRNGHIPKWDPNLKVIQDRTPSELGEAMRRESKQRHPNDAGDKGHAAIQRFGSTRRAQHHWNLREIRDRVLCGEPFPHHNGQPEKDWFDGQPLSEM